MIAGLAVTSLLCSDAIATTYYVRKSGSDSANGLSPSNAWATISRAASSMIAGDTVYVGAGTYTGTISPASSGTSGSRIRYVGDTQGIYTGDAGNVVISTWGSSYGLNINTRNYVEFAGFTINASNQYGVYVNASIGVTLSACVLSNSSSGGAFIRGSTVTFDDCTITSLAQEGMNITSVGTTQSSVTMNRCTISGIGGDGLSIWASSGVRLNDCTLTNFPDDAISVNSTGSVIAARCKFSAGPDAVAISGGGNATLDTCLLYNLGEQGIEIEASGSPYGYLINCTVASVGQDAIWVKGGTGIGLNTIFSGCGRSAMRQTGGFAYDWYNLHYANTSNTSGAVNIISQRVGDPAFVSTGTSNYRLKPNSAARDTGFSFYWYSSKDLDGVSRPINGVADVGCYEYGGTPSQPRVLSWKQVKPQ